MSALMSAAMRVLAAGLSVSETRNVLCALPADMRDKADDDVIGAVGPAMPISHDLFERI